jgi:hypothetical protein
MKKWAMLTAILYVVAIALLTVPVATLLWPKGSRPWFFLYFEYGYWIWVGFIILCALLLMAAPVRLGRTGNRSRRPLALTIAATGLLLTLLVFGAAFSIGEVLAHSHGADWLGTDGTTAVFRLVVTTAALWMFWAGALYWVTRRAAPLAAARTVALTLLAGSILELLVAVPSHVIVRGRAECCAGLYTSLGLVTGISVMFLSLGPGVFFLYRERMARIRQPVKATAQADC